MNRTERGRAGELALDRYAMVLSDGQLELPRFEPGPRLLAVIDSLGHHVPPQLIRGSERLMMARRRLF